MKIETLKDLETETDYPNPKTIVKAEDLRELAIKWIKEFKKTEDNCYSSHYPFEFSCTACSEGCGMCSKTVLINFIKHLFNITKEDLK